MALTFIVLGLLIAAGFFLYIFLMIFYPEWVGITGKSARKAMADHKEGAQADETKFFSDIKK